MIPHQYYFRALLLAVCVYALWRGRGEERAVALVCLGATLASRLAFAPLGVRYHSVEGGLLAIDLVVLASFVAVALRSRRFWPLWVAGLQLTTSMAHLMKAIDSTLMPMAYGAAIALWSYPILIILAIGTWRGQRRMHAGQQLTAAG
jgi:hypothetical protein